MKKIIYTFVIIIAVLCLNIDVKACSASDGCTNCGSGAAETACKQSDAYKQQNQATSCEERCNAISNATAKEQCLAGCRQSSGNSGNSNNNSANNSTGNNGNLPSAGAGTVLGGSGNNNTSSGNNNQTHDVQQTVTGDKKDKEELECKHIFGENSKTGKFMEDIYNIIKFLVPLLLLALSIKDYAFAIINQNADGIKKATKNFGKRLIVAIIILIMPTIINFVLEDLLDINSCI